MPVQTARRVNGRGAPIRKDAIVAYVVGHKQGEWAVSGSSS
jgi:hypothetical protein